MWSTHSDIAAHLRHAQLVAVRLGNHVGTELEDRSSHVVVQCEGRVKCGEEAPWVEQTFLWIWVAIVCVQQWWGGRGRRIISDAALAEVREAERRTYQCTLFWSCSCSSSGDDEGGSHLKGHALRGASVSRRRRLERGAQQTLCQSAAF